MIQSKLSNLLSTFKSRGLREGVRFVYYGLGEELQERRLGIQTAGLVSPEDLGHESAELLEYTPAPYNALRYCLSQVSVRPGEDSFLDYGCGMGRVIILAATKPFRRVLGVEIASELVEKARENIERASHRLKCDVQVELADARTFHVPDDVTVVHLYNPFTGDSLAQAVGQIRKSLQRRPRNLTIMFGNPGRFDAMFGGQDWLTKETFRSFYPKTGYAIYTCRPD